MTIQPTFWEVMPDETGSCANAQRSVRAQVTRASSLFNGSDYEPSRDDARLMNQLDRIKTFMLAHNSWWTLAEIEAATATPAASASAQLRHLRKAKHGDWVVQKRLRGDAPGLYEYHVSEPLSEVAA